MFKNILKRFIEILKYKVDCFAREKIVTELQTGGLFHAGMEGHFPKIIHSICFLNNLT